MLLEPVPLCGRCFGAAGRSVFRCFGVSDAPAARSERNSRSALMLSLFVYRNTERQRRTRAEGNRNTERRRRNRAAGNRNTTQMQQAHFDSTFSVLIGNRCRWAVVRRNGSILLALPECREAARRTLGLYQPQRIKARAVTAMLRLAAGAGVHRWLLPALGYHHGREISDPPLPALRPSTCGFLFGSPDHRIQRVIACYETNEGWEVAKLAEGSEGIEMLNKEARFLEALAQRTDVAPRLLGLHHTLNHAILRMPYLEGDKLKRDSGFDPLEVLESWVGAKQALDASGFPEWPAIIRGLSPCDQGAGVLGEIGGYQLTPSLHHGDFVRWNLLRRDHGQIVVLDWEWGELAGMPGLDLVHWHLQEARLVDRLEPAAALAKTATVLRADKSRAYLERCGWIGERGVTNAIIASLAFKQGAGHQQNEEILAAAVGTCGLARP